MPRYRTHITATFFLDIAEKNLLKERESILLTAIESWKIASAKIRAISNRIHFVGVLIAMSTGFNFSFSLGLKTEPKKAVLVKVSFFCELQNQTVSGFQPIEKKPEKEYITQIVNNQVVSFLA